MVMWCLWPIVQGAFVESPEPRPWIASLYLVGAWGAPWYLGRVYFWDTHGGKVLIQAVMAGLIVIIPVALIESFLGPKVYEWFYDTHPFRNDGVERYLGFRPLGFFENGNQYGIWVAVTAFAAVWLWRSAPDSKRRNLLVVPATLGVVIALASQSVGAIALLCVGLALCWGGGRFPIRGVLVLSFLLALTAGVVYLSGAIPLRSIAENTTIGRNVVNIVRSSGRGSFTWRIARDQTALRLIDENPVVGSAKWDWWRENGERPWSLAFLIVGQFGVVGLVLAFGSLLIPVFLSFVGHAWPATLLGQPERALATIVLIATVDALLNSFFFYPAILAAGALGTIRQDHLEKIESFVRVVPSSGKN
jgi:MFS family permease